MAGSQELYAHFLKEGSLGKAVYSSYLAEENRCVRSLVKEASPREAQKSDTQTLALDLVCSARESNAAQSNVESFLKEFSLDSNEGVALMCLAEALVRVPDAETAQAFIQDKLTRGQWSEHLGNSGSFWINASTWGLLLTGRLFNPTPEQGAGIVKQLVKRLGSPIILAAINRAVSVIGDQFVCGQTIEQAFKASLNKPSLVYSYDMLGEAATTEADAKRFFDIYHGAINFLADGKDFQSLPARRKPALSIKLSALESRFGVLKKDALGQLHHRVLELVLQAQKHDLPITIDAEESFLLEPMLKLFADIMAEPQLNNWPHFGVAVQAYQKRARPVLSWLRQLSIKHERKIPVRLVKGAYWDQEIKAAQQEGLDGYPVFTRKVHTDVSYIACAKYILKNQQQLYGQFATHNAHTVASVVVLAEHADNDEYEFQRLQGMGEPLYDKLLDLYPDLVVRVYAPVGKHKALLPYLVRRLLENGASTSFVKAFNNADVPDASLVSEPTTLIFEDEKGGHPGVPLPRDQYLPSRINSTGLNLNSEAVVRDAMVKIDSFLDQHYSGRDQDQSIRNPANRSHILGSRHLSTAKDCQDAVTIAWKFFPEWKATSVSERAQCLEKLADLIEQNQYHLMALLITEAGKTLKNSHNEVREAVDFCRYYASQCREKFSTPLSLTGPTGEENMLYFEGRGVFLCISPWNFPLAIMVGQVVAALAAGNCVIAKPATDSELVARMAAKLFYLAGFDERAIQFVPCAARIFATTILSDERIAGAAFTGSIETAQSINLQLAQRKGSLAATVMETGGLNAMLVDSTALPEQVVLDAVVSAFDSAGQRCSALRVLFLQEEIADRVIELLVGRVQGLRVGNPLDLETDIGPVINENAYMRLNSHIENITRIGRLLVQAPVDAAIAESGFFIPPTVVEIDHMQQLEREVFGPVLHVIRYRQNQLQEVIDQVNSARYGLTFGVHTRIESRAYELAKKVRVGNVYINRSMIGAMVGAQPFGGQGLSGTGPKSGGPNYLLRFATEKTICNNTTAIGGNPHLLSPI